MSMWRGAISGARQATRLNSTAAQSHPGYKTLEPVKNRFNIEDGSPIFVKGGAFDRILYGVTMAACAAAVGLNIKLYYDFSQK